VRSLPSVLFSFSENCERWGGGGNCSVRQTCVSLFSTCVVRNVRSPINAEHAVFSSLEIGIHRNSAVALVGSYSV
jgi:hypothetical protein